MKQDAKNGVLFIQYIMVNYYLKIVFQFHLFLKINVGWQINMPIEMENIIKTQATINPPVWNFAKYGD